MGAIGAPGAGQPGVGRDALETYGKSRIAVTIGLFCAVSGVVASAVHSRSYPDLSVLCAVNSVLYLGAALLAHRTRRYKTPGAVIGLTFLVSTIVAVSMNTHTHIFATNTLLWFALIPQLTTFLLGARAGTAMASGAILYLSVAFGLLRSGAVHDPALTTQYLGGDITILICLSLTVLYTRARERIATELRDAHSAADALRGAEQRRLKEELELATRIQTALLPRDPRVAGLTLSASLRSAAEVGGDHYDVLPFEGGAWLCMGHVAGHGIDAGLAMLMIQSAVSVIVQANPTHGPDRVLRAVDATVDQNDGQRPARDEHAALTLLRYQRDGSVLFAGTLEHILVFRASARRCETVRVGQITLGDGDVLVLYTDGLTEARDGAGQPFGQERLEKAILRTEGQPVDAIRAAVLSAVCAFSATLDHDVTLLIARFQAPAGGQLGDG